MKSFDLEQVIKERLLEIEDKKIKRLVSEQIVKDRINFIIESHTKGQDIMSISQKSQAKITLSVINEIKFSKENGLITENEGLNSLLTDLFGDGFQNIAKSIVDPLMKSILTKIGISGSILDSAVSVFLNDTNKIIESFESCDSMTNIIAHSVENSMIDDIRKNTSPDGMGNSFIKNHLVDTLRSDDKFLVGLKEKLRPIVCELYNKYLNQAKRIESAIKKPVE
jgi:hypothetical protein